MDGYMKAVGATLVAVIMILILGRQSKDLAVVLSMAACAMGALVMLTYAAPVLEFLTDLSVRARLEKGLFQLLLKAVGVGMLGEIGALVCADAGNSSLGKILQMLSGAVILWLSVPLFESLLQLMGEMMGSL